MSAWLDRVLDEILATDPGTRPPWPALSARHPLAAGRVVDPHELCARTDALPHGWETLRRAATSAALAGPVMSSALAAWFDEGSFARHLLSTTGDGAELLADVLALLAPADAGRVLVAVGDHLEP